MTKVVLDTNIFIDALFYGEEEKLKIFDLEKKKEIGLIFCDETAHELFGKMEGIRKELGFTKDEMSVVYSQVAYIMLRSSNIYIREDYPRYCEHDRDDKFIECAKIGKAEYLVSSDHHILELSTNTKERYKLSKINFMDADEFLITYNLRSGYMIINGKQIEVNPAFRINSSRD